MDLEALCKFLIDTKALVFGEFVLKSGRRSPYFLNTGVFDTGQKIRKLGEFYSEKIHEVFGKRVDVIFGPAYKGIPLAVATAEAFHRNYRMDVGYVFNRKELKQHGEGGFFIGHAIDSTTNVIVVDDVITTGETKREAVTLLTQNFNCNVLGVIVLLDREELIDGSELTATQTFEKETGIKVFPLARISELLPYLDTAQKRKIEVYLKRYGNK